MYDILWESYDPDDLWFECNLFQHVRSHLGQNERDLAAYSRWWWHVTAALLGRLPSTFEAWESRQGLRATCFNYPTGFFQSTARHYLLTECLLWLVPQETFAPLERYRRLDRAEGPEAHIRKLDVGNEWVESVRDVRELLAEIRVSFPKGQALPEVPGRSQG